MENSIKSPQWNFIIPFYFGENKYVTGRGGAPVSKKICFLSKTVDAIQNRIKNSEIIITVCDETSARAAKSVLNSVCFIDCPPLHLPMMTVRLSARKAPSVWRPDDIVVFTEDDQILFIADGVKNDIEQFGDRYFFSPHRWVRTPGLSGPKGAPKYRLGSQAGIIDNVDKEQNGGAYALHHRYRSQHHRTGAYAACWATQCASLQSLDFSEYENDPGLIRLETASYLLLSSPLPVLKLDLCVEDPASFLVNHLSGYFYFKRALSIKRLLNHFRRLRF